MLVEIKHRELIAIFGPVWQVKKCCNKCSTSQKQDVGQIGVKQKVAQIGFVAGGTIAALFVYLPAFSDPLDPPGWRSSNHDCDDDTARAV